MKETIILMNLVMNHSMFTTANINNNIYQDDNKAMVEEMKKKRLNMKG